MKNVFKMLSYQGNANLTLVKVATPNTMKYGNAGQIWEKRILIYCWWE